SGETSGSRGQVARKLLQEGKRIMARVQMQEDCGLVTLRQAAEYIGSELQDFLIEKFLTRKKNWEEILEELEKHVREEEVLKQIEIQKRLDVEEMIELMRTTIREERESDRRMKVGAGQRYKSRPKRIESCCFVCGKSGHIARSCSLRKGGSDRESKRYENKEFNSSCVQSILELESNMQTERAEFNIKRVRVILI
ncbi:hypothetical protein NGRA_3305, partial [Nosema granulosis]